MCQHLHLLGVSLLLHYSMASFSLQEILERYQLTIGEWFSGQYEGYEDLLSKPRYIIRVEPSPMSIALNEIWNMCCNSDQVWKGITVANNDCAVRLWAEDVSGDLNGNYFRITSIDCVQAGVDPSSNPSLYSVIMDIKMEGMFPTSMI